MQISVLCNATTLVLYFTPQSDLESFSGHIQYPLPNKRATASRIGYGGNAIVFVVFHAGKEFAVKKVLFYVNVYLLKNSQKVVRPKKSG